MNLNDVLHKKILITIGIGVLFLTALHGCGKSANELYREGKNLIQNKETIAEGVKILKQYEKKYPKDSRTPEVVLALAMAYQGQKQYDEAVKTFNRLIEKYQGTPEAYKGLFLLGYMYYDEIKDNEKTVNILKKFIETYPDSGLVTSAQALIDNVGLPIEEWSVVQKIGLLNQPSDSLHTGK